MHHYTYQVGVTHPTLNEVLWEAKKSLRRAYDNNVEGYAAGIFACPDGNSNGHR